MADPWACFDVIERAVEDGKLVGAAAGIGGTDAADVYGCFGLTEAGGEDVTPDTWYDLASLTKVMVTVPLLLEQVGLGRLDPRAPLRDVLPDAAWLQPTPSLADATVLQLATHTSGLPAWQPLYTLGLDRPTLRARLLHIPLERAPGEIVYSDLGYLVLGYLLERLTGRPLDEQAATLFEGVGLREQLRFQPDEPRGDVAPTETCPWRERLLRGEVHDENAAAFGGVAGHAGLFGTLRGVVGFAHAQLEGRLLAPAAVDYLAHPHAVSAIDGERRGFGWALAFPGWSGGDFASPRTIGHTGFTGTGVWIDLERERHATLLTNAVHPTRHRASGIVALRRAFNHAASVSSG